MWFTSRVTSTDDTRLLKDVTGNWGIRGLRRSLKNLDVITSRKSFGVCDVKRRILSEGHLLGPVTARDIS